MAEILRQSAFFRWATEHFEEGFYTTLYSEVQIYLGKGLMGHIS